MPDECHQSAGVEEAGYLSVLVLKARDLIPMDSNGLSDPYAVVTLGKTVCQTNVIGKTLHPSWKEEFTFTFERDMRFIEITVFDRDLTSSDFEGSVKIPLMELPANKRIRAWYPLGLRSSKDKLKGALGDVLIELYTNVKMPELPRAVMQKVSSIPGLNFNLGRAPTGEPLILPPPKLEHLEDLACQVTLRGVADNDVTYFSGALVLTNYRVVFLSDGLLDEATENRAAWDDLAMQVALGNVLNAEVGTIEGYPSLTISAADGKVLQFVFDGMDLQKAPAGTSAQGVSTFGHRKLPPLPARVAVSKFAERMQALDRYHLEEGPAEVRMQNRLLWYVNNPWYLEHFAQTAHDSIVQPNKAPGPPATAWNAAAPDPSTAEAETGSPENALVAAWAKYDVPREMERLGIDPEGLAGWRLTDLNKRYRMSPSYPSIIAVPASADDRTVEESARFRHMGRLPTMVWRDVATGVVLCRSSEPLNGAEQSDGDTKLVASITASQLKAGNDNDPGSPRARQDSAGSADSPRTSGDLSPRTSGSLVVADCRSKNVGASAFGWLTGKTAAKSRAYPTVSSLEYLELGNYEVVCKSYDQMLDLHNTVDNTERYGTFPSQLLATGWLEHQRHLLSCVLFIIDLMSVRKQSVLVHADLGGDHTSTIASVVQLCLDPYFRTLDGFVHLVEKEWLSFGHKFQTRAGRNREHPEQRSPVFRQFLETSWQVLQQMPHAFEFNEELLYVLWEHCYSGWFGTFLMNTERDRVQADLRCKSLSIWSVVDHNRSQYLNPEFKADGQGPIYPVACSRQAQLWPKLWFSWYNKVHEAGWAQRVARSSC